MKTSTVFKKAKDFVTLSGNDAWRKYICYAIEDCYGIPGEDRKRAKHVIRTRLGTHNSLEKWMSAKIGTPKSFQLSYEQRCKMQETRHAWLDSLIIEFEAKGD